ncbi:hypothetical protein DPMN_130763 [Dreissena polymorpha]|uniref:Uncharacterized protein n=1 Tax=Dreissena polymorpha TaxID=45954 RepID=A0A9D4H783_DREPO|nr:hypothetical protein DPMN_130763 [Dreissena polymorpha]
MYHVYPAHIKDEKDSENDAPCKPRSENDTPCKPVGATPCKLDYENPLKTSNDMQSQTVQNVRRVLMTVQLPTQSKPKNQPRKRQINIKEKKQCTFAEFVVLTIWTNPSVQQMNQWVVTTVVFGYTIYVQMLLVKSSL